MWSSGILIFSFAALAAADYGWIPGHHYVYNLTAINFAAMHQVANQISGIQIKGELHIDVDSVQQLTLQVQNTKYVDFNHNRTNKWELFTPEPHDSYKNFPLTTATFQLKINNGLVEKIVVPRDTPYWQRNWYKGIATQFQLDTQAQNLKPSKSNDVPHDDQNTGVFSTMEESIHGKYKTNYDISVLPERYHDYQNDFESISESVNLKNDDSQYYQIVKTRNFSNSEVHVVYRYGLNGHEGWEEGTNTMGNILTRTSHSKIELFGNLKEYTILSTQTKDDVIVAPHLYNSQKGIVSNLMTLFLLKVTKSNGPSSPIENPETESLIYQYQSQNSQFRDQLSPSFSSEEESDSSSSEVNDIAMGRRQTRSANRNEHSSGSSSSSESSISSSEEYLAPPPGLNEGPNIDFIPEGRVAGDGDEITQNIVKKANEIGNLEGKPTEKPEDNVLNHFEALTTTVSVSTPQQLHEATERLYYSNENLANREATVKYRSWQAFRDAVAEAGTGPALVTISSWIKTGKVRGNEAAQVLSVLPRAARYPTTEYVAYYFELVKTEEVQGQKYLFDSAILSFSDLVRMSQVDGKSAQHRYPIKMSGTQSQNDRAVVEEYIPYFQRQLKDAIAQGDSPKIQVYIRAIGNFAHQKILAVFEPYLEGKLPLTQFQRISIIGSLYHFIDLHPNTARSVLYRIYQNLGEAPEIRVAAVIQLMKTNPPAQMLQRMAEQTNYDHSKHVNAVVKSAIESAASGEYYTDPQFIGNARSAANFLTTEEFDLQYSKTFKRSYTAREHDRTHYEHDFSYLYGLDGSYPIYVGYNLIREIGGYRHEPRTVGFMSSNSREFFNLFFKSPQTGDNESKIKSFSNPKQGKLRTPSSEYSYKKTLDFLNAQFEDKPVVEGNFFFNLFGGDRYFPFANHSIEQISELLLQIDEKFQQDSVLKETKYYYPHRIEIRFPMVGFDGFFAYTERALAGFEFEGEKIQRQQLQNNGKLPLSVDYDGQFLLRWSQQTLGEWGFSVPFSQQKYVAVAEKAIEFNGPWKGKVQWNRDTKAIKVSHQPHSDNNDHTKLFQYRTHILTAFQNISDYSHYLKGKNAKLIYTGPVSSYQKEFGKEYTGYSFQVDAQSDNDFYDVLRIAKAFKSLDYDYFLSGFWYDLSYSIGNNYYALSYNLQNTSPEQTGFSFSFSYDSEEYGTENDSQKSSRLRHHKSRKVKSSSNLAQPSSVDNRVEELTKNAKSDIEYPRTYIYDVLFSFGENKDKGKYTFTTVFAESPVSEKSRLLAFLSGRPFQESQDAKLFQTAIQVDYKKPQVEVFNYRQAYEANPTSYVNGQINIDQGENSEILFEGKFQQTEKRRQYLKQHEYIHVCEEQMQEGHYILPACRNASYQANVLDKYDITFKYRNVPQNLQKAAYFLYGAVRQLGYHYNQENFVGVENQEGTFNFGATFSEDLKYYNYSFVAPSFTSYFNNLKFNQFLEYFFLQYPAYNQLYLFSPYFYNTIPYATCVLDGNEASTFNNRSYTVQLGDVYHVLAITVPQGYQKGNQESSDNSNYFENYAILAKESGSQQKEILVVLGDDVVTLEPASSEGVKVQANGKTIPISDKKIARWENAQNEFLAYALPGDKNAVLYFAKHGLQLYYDGQRIAITSTNEYRNKVRGLCGTFDGEPANDFTTPANCVLKDHQSFAASYAITDESNQGSGNDYNSQAQNSQCYPKVVEYGDVVSDAEAGRGPRAGVYNRSKNSTKSQQGCTSHKVMIVEAQGKTCFSIKPQLSCNANCKPQGTIDKTIQYHCLNESSATRHWVMMVKKGANPDFSQKKSNHQMIVRLPEKCVSSL